MIEAERHNRIHQHLRQHGVLSQEEGVRLMAASPATIRRDFDKLAGQNGILRVHGGLRLPPSFHDTTFASREIRNAAAKSAIARRAVKVLREGDVIFIDGGTTTFQLAACLPRLKLRLITNSIRLAAALDERAADAGWEVFLTGGLLYPQSGLLIGPAAQNNLAQYHAHWAFLSAGGITPDGVFNTNELVVESEKVMMAHADQVVILADHSKIGCRAMCQVCPLTAIDALLTDRAPAAPTRQALRRAGVDVLVSGRETGPGQAGGGA
jgi:DeoR/GlpR family transcriptional regulator of sugar metabolism